MLHDGRVNVVEDALENHLRLAAAEADFSFLDQAVAVFDLDIFLRGSRDESDITVQFAHEAAVRERCAGCGNGSELSCMAAGMDRSGRWVGILMCRNCDRIQFAHERYLEVMRSSLQVRADAGDGEAVFMRHAQLIQEITELGGSLYFLVAVLGFTVYGLIECENIFFSFIDSVTEELFEFFLALHMIKPPADEIVIT